MQNNSSARYFDNFEDEIVGQRPSHWIEPASYQYGMQKNWKVLEKFGSHVYGTLNTDDKTMSYLHVFDKNTLMKAEFYVGEMQNFGNIGFVFRMAPEDTFLKIGYSNSIKKWYLEQERADGSAESILYAENEFIIRKDCKYTVDVSIQERNLHFSVDDVPVLLLEHEELICNGYGRIGVYTDKAQLFINQVEICLGCGMEPSDGVLESIFGEPEAGFSATQTVDMKKGKLLALSNKGRRAYQSEDYGTTWREITDTEGAELLSIQACYQNILKLKNGTYLSVRDLSFEVYCSDDMIHWEKISQIQLPDKYDPFVREYVDDFGRGLYMGHINSMVQFTLEEGVERIFYPITKFAFEDELTKRKGSFNCKTVVYYSDDNGVTWKHSQNDSSAFDFAHVDEQFVGNWGEAKLLQCPDGVIRMYSSRSFAPVLLYTESFDGGLTWKGIHAIPEIQTAVSSISMTEDTYEKGTFYLTWVNDVPSPSGRGSVRTRLSLAKSNDGRVWEYLMDVERTVIRYNVDERQTTHLFQIIDPNITITKDYIYVNYGSSVGIGHLAEKDLDELALIHGRVARRYTRIPKAQLRAREWNCTNITNMQLTKHIELIKKPKTEYVFGEIFSIEGGEVRVTLFDGTTYTQPLKELFLYKTPNMMKTGNQTITFYNRNFQQIRYEITVTANVVNRYGDETLSNHFNIPGGKK